MVEKNKLASHGRIINNNYQHFNTRKFAHQQTISQMSIRVGYVPEHFSTPIQFAQLHGFFQQNGLKVDLIAYPSGSGHMITSLNNNELDIAIGLTEAFVRGVADTTDVPYEIISTYVTSPLNWAVSTGVNRDDIKGVASLENKKIGVSRIGSGSYVMSYVLALEQQFKSNPPYSDWPICNTFARLREAVNDKTCDAFMWEYFTTKKYYETPHKELKMVGNIYTPWPSWVVVRNKTLTDQQTRSFMKALDQGIHYFKDHQEEAVEYIYKNLDYSESDAREWLSTVVFQLAGAKDAMKQTVDLLVVAGVLKHGQEPDILKRNLETGHCETWST